MHLSIKALYCPGISAQYDGETETIRAKLTKPVDAQESAYSHEGYGVHYLPDFPWEPHKWYRMLLRCTQSETTDNTTIEQWVFDISRNSWTKICVFDLGIPELTFTGKTCVFLENFDAKSSGEIRSLEFKNARVYNSESKSWSDIESAKRLDLEVAARPSIIEVGSELRAIDAQFKFFFTAMVLVTMEDVVESKGISQEYPSPPEINAELEVGFRPDFQSLSLAVARSTEMNVFHPCAVFEHERQVILIG